MHATNKARPAVAAAAVSAVSMGIAAPLSAAEAPDSKAASLTSATPTRDQTEAALVVHQTPHAANPLATAFGTAGPPAVGKATAQAITYAPHGHMA